MKPKRRRSRAAPSAIRDPRPPIAHPAWRRIRLFAMDVDGILTDGTVTINADGIEAKTFSIVDGRGLVRCRESGVILAWISGRASAATTVRARELGIRHIIQGRNDKLAALQALARRLRLQAVQVCYMGDDDVDAPALAWAGIGVTVPEAQPEALTAAAMVTSRPGGRGAVREVCELILRGRVP